MSRFGDLLSGESVTPPVVDTAPSSVEPVVEEAPRPEEDWISFKDWPTVAVAGEKRKPQLSRK